jgi:Terminase large subunit, T4likevirus-type, N-terminal
MIAKDLSRALDPTLLANACGIEPDPWQAELLRTMPRRALLCCSRQSGKSTVSGLIALHTALYTPAALVLLVSPSQRQSGELFRVVMNFYRQLEGAAPLIQESALRVQFGNGSRIISLPGSEKTTRGYSKATLIVVDEAAYAPDDLLAALKPSMATSKGGGKLICLSTPAGRRGFFYEAWEHGGDVWTRVRVPASECPRISKEFLAEEWREHGPMKFAQEYELSFVDDSCAAFAAGIIEAAFTTEIKPLWM